MEVPDYGHPRWRSGTTVHHSAMRGARGGTTTASASGGTLPLLPRRAQSAAPGAAPPKDLRNRHRHDGGPGGASGLRRRRLMTRVNGDRGGGGLSAAFASERFESRAAQDAEASNVRRVQQTRTGSCCAFGSRVARIWWIVASRSRLYVAIQLSYVAYVFSNLYVVVVSATALTNLQAATVAGDTAQFGPLLWAFAVAQLAQWACANVHFYAKAKLPVEIRRVLSQELHERYFVHVTEVVRLRKRQAAAAKARKGVGKGGAGDGADDGRDDSDGDNVDATIDNPDQRIVEDVKNLGEVMMQFCTFFVGQLFQAIAFGVYMSQLKLGSSTWTLIMVAYAMLTFLLVQGLVRSIAAHIYSGDRWEGDFRFGHGFLARNAEAIAFFEAGDGERRRADASFGMLLANKYRIMWRRVPLNFMSNFNAYAQTMLVYLILALQLFYTPFGGSDGKDLSPSELNGQVTLFTQYAQASLGSVFALLGSLIDDGPGLLGGVGRVAELLETFDRLDTERRDAAGGGAGGGGGDGASKANAKREHGTGRDDPERGDAVGDSHAATDVLGRAALPGELVFSRVAVEPPQQEPMPGNRGSGSALAVPSRRLFDGFTLAVRVHQHVLVTAPNGRGKSALIRALTGVWPLAAGSIECGVASRQLVVTPTSRPAQISPRDVFVIPQQAFFPISSTLREQIAFPSVVTDTSLHRRATLMQHSSRGGGCCGCWCTVGAGSKQAHGNEDDGELRSALLAHDSARDGDTGDGDGADPDGAHMRRLLNTVGLAGLPSRVGGLDTEQPWDELLSVGEQQRLVLARLLYHAPQGIAVLDEATSALNVELEQHMHRVLRGQGFSVLSVGAERLSPLHDVTVRLPDVVGGDDGGSATDSDGRSSGGVSDLGSVGEAGTVVDTDADAARNLPRGRYAGATAGPAWAPAAARGDVATAEAAVSAASKRTRSGGPPGSDTGSAVLTPAAARAVVQGWSAHGRAEARARANAAATVYSCVAIRRVMLALRLMAASPRVKLLALAAAAISASNGLLHAAGIASSSDVVGDIVARRRSALHALVGLVILSAIRAAAAAVHALVYSGESGTGGLLTLSSRDTLQRALHAGYFGGRGYYRVSLLRDAGPSSSSSSGGGGGDSDNLASSGSIDNAAQRMVEDASSLCLLAVGFVFVGIVNPVATTISLVIGLQGQHLGVILLILSPLILVFVVVSAAINPQWTRLTYAETVCEGDFRRAHVALRESAESVAMAGGLGHQALRIGAHLNAALEAQWAVQRFGALTQRLTALLWSITTTIAAPAMPYLLFYYDWPILADLGLRDADAGPLATLQGSPSEKFGQLALLSAAFSVVTSLTSDVGNAIGQLPGVVAAGNRVGELLDALGVGRGEREGGGEGDGACDDDDGGRGGGDADAGADRLAKVVVEHATIAVPGNGRVLVRDLSFAVGAGLRDDAESKDDGGTDGARVYSSLLIEGPSGSGKTSLLRTVAGLWSPQSGRALRPRRVGRDGLFFLPQRPFMVPDASLAQQIVYPRLLKGVRGVGDGGDGGHDDDAISPTLGVDSGDDSAEHNDVTAEAEPLLAVLHFVGLDYLVHRCARHAARRRRRSDDASGSAPSVAPAKASQALALLGALPWSALSLGEQQRLSMARLLWHHPAVAAVDECSSAVDAEMEARFYERCAADGIAIVSVGHRLSLRRHHEAVLRLDGEGGWNVEVSGSGGRGGGDRT